MSDVCFLLLDVWCLLSFVHVRHLIFVVWCQASCIRRLMFVVWCETSDIRCLISDVWCLFLMSDVWCLLYIRRLMPHVRCLMFVVWCQSSDIRCCLMSDVWYLLSYVRRLIFVVWCQASDIRRLMHERTQAFYWKYHPTKYHLEVPSPRAANPT